MRMLKSGKILLGGWEVPCTVRSLSESGACVEVQTTYGIPALFQFIMLDWKTPQSCKVMWRDDRRLGIYFQERQSP